MCVCVRVREYCVSVCRCLSVFSLAITTRVFQTGDSTYKAPAASNTRSRLPTCAIQTKNEQLIMKGDGFHLPTSLQDAGSTRCGVQIRVSCCVLCFVLFSLRCNWVRLACVCYCVPFVCFLSECWSTHPVAHINCCAPLQTPHAHAQVQSLKSTPNLLTRSLPIRHVPDHCVV